MTDEVVFLNDRRKDADQYAELSAQLLDCARLIDLAVHVHFKEGIGEQPISEYGPTLDFALHDLRWRLHKLVDQLWDRGADPAA